MGAFRLKTRPKTKSRLIEIHGFLPFSARRCALVPIPVHPPDLSRPLRGPYESSRPNPRVQANDGANPYGGVRPRALARVFPKLTKLRAALSAPNTSSAGVHACRLVFRGIRGAGIHIKRFASKYPCNGQWIIEINLNNSTVLSCPSPTAPLF